ncbi:TPA: alginate export family protein [Pseudomonas aeruginosa]|nr:alginate export family protein [Pseudomonas aeruginosa]HBO8619950.1 alginate export family protein [Pseudomonas aeruginosa]
MTDDHSFRPRPTSLSAALLLGAWIAQPATAAYVEAGRPGDPASWRSAEYQQDWGLERMRADQAYAAGIDGQGVKIGEMDSGFDPSHPDTPASRYQPVTASGTYVDGTPFSVSGATNGNNDSHGTHVGGTLGASRDGVGMHGVAYAAQVYVANTNQNDSFLFGPTPDPNYFKAAYQALADAGVRAINNSWGSQPKDVSYETLDGLHAAYAQHYGRSTWLDAAAGVSRQGVINVFSAGNSGYANASVRSALPYFQPDLEGHWLAVSGLDQQNGQRYNRCGIAKYWCITTPGRLINSTMPGGGYANKSGTSMAAPHATGALALVMQRYPYLNNEQALQVLLTTATQLDGTPTGAPTDTVGWGVPDLGRAMHGPGQLLGRFEANLPAGLRDEWSNPISDSALLQRQAEDAAEHAAWQRTLKDKGWENGLPAGASQQERTDYAIGMARDQAAAQRQYQGSLVKAGVGYARGSGGGKDGEEQFQQTGLESNRSNFTGTRSRVHRFGEAFRGELSNLQAATLFGSWQLREDYDASLVYHKFWRVDDDSDIGTSGINAALQPGEKDIGQELDLVVTKYFKQGLLPASMSQYVDEPSALIRFRGGLFKPGDAYGPGTDSTMHRAFVDFIWRF